MKLKVKLVDILTGYKVVLLNKSDAMNFGVRPHDRIKVKTAQKDLTAIVNITDSYVEQGEIGITPAIKEIFNSQIGDTVEIVATGMPSSMEYIHKKMAGRSLNQKEIHTIIKDIVDGNLSELEI
ncbi:MAG: hypothetical protein QW831_05495, partial [Candidatus Jordarchaeaceae archaeon]